MNGDDFAARREQELCRRHEVIHGVSPRRGRRRVRRDRRPVRLRQVHAAAHGGGAGGDHQRRDRHRRARRQRSGAARARHRHGVPELRALPAHEGLRQHGLRPEDREHAEGRDQGAGGQGGGHAGARPLSRPQAARAVRRPAPAGRDGPRAGARSGGLPVRRAAVEPRRQAAGADARWRSSRCSARSARHRFTSPTTRSRR